MQQLSRVARDTAAIKLPLLPILGKDFHKHVPVRGGLPKRSSLRGLAADFYRELPVLPHYCRLIKLVGNPVVKLPW